MTNGGSKKDRLWVRKMCCKWITTKYRVKIHTTGCRQKVNLPLIAILLSTITLITGAVVYY